MTQMARAIHGHEEEVIDGGCGRTRGVSDDDILEMLEYNLLI